MNSGPYESARVRLRPLRNEDSSLLYSWITNRELVVLNAPFHPVSEAEHAIWMKRMVEKRSDLVIFVIEDKETNQAIGTCQLLNIHPVHRNAELQIRIGGDFHRGKGIGPEAIRLLTCFGFDDLNLHRIYLHVFSSNKAALRAYQKCGFAIEGTLREAAHINGSWVDVIAMGLLKHKDA